MSEFTMTFRQWLDFVSKRIADARNDAGMSQSELATSAGLPLEFIERVERGETSPSYHAREKIALATKKPVEFFEPFSKSGIKGATP